MTHIWNERSKQRALPVASLTTSANKTWYTMNVTFIMQAELASTDYATADALMTAVDSSVEEAYGYGTLSAYLEAYCNCDAAITSVATTTEKNYPSLYPTSLPTMLPSPLPTEIPSAAPTSVPSPLPTNLPTLGPTPFPSATPTPAPSATPSLWQRRNMIKC